MADVTIEYYGEEPIVLWGRKWEKGDKESLDPNRAKQRLRERGGDFRIAEQPTKSSRGKKKPEPKGAPASDEE